MGNEHRYMAAAVTNGHISGDGPFTRRSTDLLEAITGTHRVQLTTSCTHALEMAALLLNTHPGDEIIIPSFTFTSTINAFVLRGARPIFVDIRPDTLNLDERLLESAITDHTRAIVVVHYAGVGCEMDTILDVAGRHGLEVIEDNAHGLFGRYRGNNLGTFGGLATQSFHETKNITCGEGGALLINDPRYVERAEIIRDKGTNRRQFFRGQVDKYTWVDIGSSFLPSDILAAFLYAQLEARDQIQSRRQHIWQQYHDRLAPWAQEHGVGLPVIPDYCEHPSHMYYLLLPSVKFRQNLIEHLRLRGILAVIHYVPLHLSRMGVSFGAKVGDCPVTEDISQRLLRLPLYNDLSATDQDWVIASIEEFAEEHVFA